MDENITLVQPDGSHLHVSFAPPAPVAEGDTVSTGQIVGRTGTGNVTFSHLSVPPASPTPTRPPGTTPLAFELEFAEHPLD